MARKFLLWLPVENFREPPLCLRHITKIAISIGEDYMTIFCTKIINIELDFLDCYLHISQGPVFDTRR